MILFGNAKERMVGLDIGHAAVKAVRLVRKGRQVRIDACALLDCRSEGIVDETELRSALGPWLKDLGWDRDDLVAGVPQYLGTIQVSDFPPGAHTDLDSMVAYETQQLAGLSESRFIHDYQILEPKFGRRNPALIGICRESVIEDRMENLTEAGLAPSDFGMEGIATANALMALYPETRKTQEPQLILDIGAENSTLIFLAGGQVLFCSSLFFGADRYTEALSQHLEVAGSEAEKTKRETRLNPTDEQSPLAQATQVLEGELRTAVDNWRSQERPEIANKMFAAVHLCGGGARLLGLPDRLSRIFGCPARVAGVSQQPGADPDPTLLTAYGLALQGLGQADLAVSLAPPDVRWLTQRRHRFGYLAAAFTVLAVALGLFFYREHQRLTRLENENEERAAELQRCQQLIPDVEEVMGRIRYQERMLLPFVNKGNRARHFLVALDELGTAKAPGDWFIYLADTDSYEAGKKKEQEEAASRQRARRPDRGGDLMAMSLMGAGDIGDTSVIADPFENRRLVDEVRPLRALIVAGYTPLNMSQPYKPVRDVVEKLNTSPTFEDVDLLPEPERKGREDIFLPWVQLFSRVDGVRYKAFTLKMPFASVEIHPERIDQQ